MQFLKIIHVLQVRLEPITEVLLTLRNQNDLETQDQKCI